VRCIRTATVGGVGNLVIVGPPLLNPDESDAQCTPDQSSRSLHLIRYQGKEMLQDYSMGTDSEPGEYVRQ
jgi:hypothetical protein